MKSEYDRTRSLRGVFFYFLLLVRYTTNHKTDSMNNCNMASSCTHDGKAVCGWDPGTYLRREFLDECDMYEYMCDYGLYFELVDCYNHNDSDMLKLKRPTDTTTVRGLKKIIIGLKKLKNFTTTVTKSQSRESSNQNVHGCKNNCYRPWSWVTTARGETRDFYRMLNDLRNKFK